MACCLSAPSRYLNNCWLIIIEVMCHLPEPVFCLLLGVSSDYAQSVTGQVTEVTCPVIGRAQPELTPNKRQKTGPEDNSTNTNLDILMWYWELNSGISILSTSRFQHHPGANELTAWSAGGVWLSVWLQVTWLPGWREIVSFSEVSLAASCRFP